MDSTVVNGEGFELCTVDRVAWIRLWWDDGGNEFDDRVTSVIRREANESCGGLVIDLREAPPLANFSVRRRISAVLLVAAQSWLPTIVLVGPSSLQHRDMQRLCSEHATIRVTRERNELFEWLEQQACAI